MYANRNDGQERLFNYLKHRVELGDIVIVFSFSIIMELLQEFDDRYSEDRKARALFIKELCKSNVFKFFQDIGVSEDAYNDVSDWLPEFFKKEFEIDSFVSRLVDGLLREPDFPKYLKKIVAKGNGINRLLVKKPYLFNLRELKFFFSEECYEKDIIRSYILGTISKCEASRLLQTSFSDPQNFFNNYFGIQGLSNFFTKPFHKASEALHTLIEKTNEIIRVDPSVGSEMEQFDVEKYWMRIYDFFPPHTRELINAYIRDNHKKSHLQRSDAADITHAIYIKYSDLWRGDKHFSNLLIRQKIVGHEKIVPKLKDLPSRIDDALILSGS